MAGMNKVYAGLADHIAVGVKYVYAPQIMQTFFIGEKASPDHRRSRNPAARSPTALLPDMFYSVGFLQTARLFFRPPPLHFSPNHRRLHLRPSRFPGRLPMQRQKRSPRHSENRKRDDDSPPGNGEIKGQNQTDSKQKPQTIPPKDCMALSKRP